MPKAAGSLAGPQTLRDEKERVTFLSVCSSIPWTQTPESFQYFWGLPGIKKKKKIVERNFFRHDSAWPLKAFQIARQFFKDLERGLTVRP